MTPIIQSQKSILELFKEKSKITIGRHEGCDVVINHPSISRVHATIEKKSHACYILYDHGAINGIFINGKKVVNALEITPADIILIGHYAISLQGEAKNLSKEIAIYADRISKEYDGGKIALHPTTLSLESQQLVAIMGPSGCGKSTLLKALTGDSPPTSGQVYLYGLELQEHYEYIKTNIGYVPQDDIIHHALTVSESLRYSAKLRLGDIDENALDAKVEEVLKALGISHLKNSLVGKVSGGQRKRIAIATEILTDPLILFLDEPTSPLDPQTIEDFLNCLRGLVNRGTTILMVTHKPEDLYFVDQVIFMAEGGYLSYFGDRRSYLSYFQVEHVVQIYGSLVSPTSKQWIDRYQKEHPIQETKPQTPSAKLKQKADINYFSQYLWLTKRYFNIKLNDKINTLMVLAQAPIIASLICFIFSDISLGVLFATAISAVWFGTNNAIREIIDEASIFKRERMFNQAIPTYILSKFTVLSVFSFLQSAIFIVILNLYFSDNRIDWRDPWMSLLWIWMLSVCATTMGLFLSSLVSSAEKVMTLLPVTLIPQVLLAGMISKIKNSTIELLSYFTLSRWGTEGFCLLQKKIIEEQINPITNEEERMTFKAIDILKKHHHSDYMSYFPDSHHSLALDMQAIICLTILFLIGTYWNLKKKDAVKSTR